jgi:putative transposase
VRPPPDFTTRAEATTALFEYIDGFYNPKRIQKRLDWLSPDEYEEAYYTSQAATERLKSTAPEPAPTS